MFLLTICYTCTIYTFGRGLVNAWRASLLSQLSVNAGPLNISVPCLFFSNSFRQRSNRPPESPLTLHFEDVRKTFSKAQWWWALAARAMADSEERNSKKHGERNCGRSVLWQWRWIQRRYAGRRGSYSHSIFIAFHFISFGCWWWQKWKEEAPKNQSSWNATKDIWNKQEWSKGYSTARLAKNK